MLIYVSFHRPRARDDPSTREPRKFPPTIGHRGPGDFGPAGTALWPGRSHLLRSPRADSDARGSSKARSWGAPQQEGKERTRNERKRREREGRGRGRWRGEGSRSGGRGAGGWREPGRRAGPAYLGRCPRSRRAAAAAAGAGTRRPPVPGRPRGGGWLLAASGRWREARGSASALPGPALRAGPGSASVSSARSSRGSAAKLTSPRAANF